MASLISHGVVALAIAQAEPSRVKRTLGFWFFAVVASLLPDLDAIGFKLGIHYGDLLGHRGLSHSLVCALFIGCLMAIRFRRVPGASLTRLAVLFTVITASHGVLDAMTNGGLGVAFFSPWDQTRYFFSWRPIKVSPIGLTRFFTPRGWEILRNEMLWIWSPALIVGMFLFALHKISIPRVGDLRNK